jgi:hypothetical protein
VNVAFDAEDLTGEHDNSRDRCGNKLYDERHIELSFHLFAASELRSYFAEDFDIENFRGLDLFHPQFAPDPRWNPASLAVDTQFSDELGRFEETYATSSGFVKRAIHLLLMARRRQAAAKSESEPNFGTDTLSRRALDYRKIHSAK